MPKDGQTSASRLSRSATTGKKKKERQLFYRLFEMRIGARAESSWDRVRVSSNDARDRVALTDGKQGALDMGQIVTRRSMLLYCLESPFQQNPPW